jgi:hypothetical protein
MAAKTASVHQHRNCNDTYNRTHGSGQNIVCLVDYLDHGYITIDYLNINIKGNVYKNSSATTKFKAYVS